MNASQTSLIGFAVLRANYDAKAPSYVDNFRSFALDILCQHQSGISRTDLAQVLRSRFGLTTPDLVVEKILRRAVRDGVARRDGEMYWSTDKGQKSAPDVTASIARYERQQNELVAKYTNFIKENYPEHSKDLSVDSAGELARYLAVAQPGSSSPQPDPEVTLLARESCASARRCVARRANRFAAAKDRPAHSSRRYELKTKLRSFSRTAASMVCGGGEGRKPTMLHRFNINRFG